MPNVFISYRRDDAAGFASWIHDRLEREFGRGHVFMDVDSLRPGEDFVSRLQQALEHADVALILMGPTWLDARDEDGVRRLDRPDDYVRMEITGAVQAGARVIPVLVDGARMPASTALPQDLRWLTRLHGLQFARQGGIAALIGALTEDRPEDAGHRRQRRAILTASAVLVGVAVIATVALLVLSKSRHLSRVAVGLHPDAIAFGDGSVWVSDVTGATITQLNGKSGRVSGAPIPVGNTPGAVSVGDGSVWVSNQLSHTVSRIAANSGEVLATIPVSFAPAGSAVGSSSIWVADPFGGTVARINASTDRLTPMRIPVGKGANAIAVEQGSVWIAGGVSDTVTRIDERSGKVIARIPVPYEPDGIVVAGDSVWAVEQFGNAVARINPGSNAVLSTIRVGEAPEGVTAGGGSVWVADNGSNTVTQIDAASASVIATIVVGSHPRGIAFGNRRVWVADAGDGTVTGIPAGEG